MRWRHFPNFPYNKTRYEYITRHFAWTPIWLDDGFSVWLSFYYRKEFWYRHSQDSNWRKLSTNYEYADRESAEMDDRSPL